MAFAGEIFRRDQEIGPVEAAITGLQQGHAPDISRNRHRRRAAAIDRGAGKKFDGFDAAVDPVVDQTDAAAAQAGAARHGDRSREIGGNDGVGGAAARRQNVAADQRRARLVGDDAAEKPFDEADFAFIGAAAYACAQPQR
jgi:hypothetical protein